MRRRIAPALTALALAILGGLFPPDRPATAPQLAAHDKLFFALQIADERGLVLAEPKLLGLGGVPLQMTLADPKRLAEPRLQLSLLPHDRGDGSYEVAFELSLPGTSRGGKGSLLLRPGEEKKTRVRYPGGHLDVQLAAFAVPSAELQLYLEHGALQGPGRT